MSLLALPFPLKESNLLYYTASTAFLANRCSAFLQYFYSKPVKLPPETKNLQNTAYLSLCFAGQIGYNRIKCGLFRRDF